MLTILIPWLVVVAYLMVCTTNAIVVHPNRPEAEALELISPRMGHIGPKEWVFEITGPIGTNESDASGKCVLVILAKINVY